MVNRRVFIAALLAAAAPASAAAENPLLSVKTWMYLLQRLEEPSVVEELAASSYDLLVLDGVDMKDGSLEAAKLVRQLSRKPGGGKRLLLAYVNIGHAEEYRIYWRSEWRAPAGGRAGDPDFLLAPDSAGWEGEYGVAFWTAEWKRIWLGEDGMAARLARLGFDGIYMDWVTAYEEPFIARRAGRDGVDPALEMVRFVGELRAAGRRINPEFVAVAQNATGLIGTPGFAEAIDGLGVEDTWFRGAANAEWTSREAGDLPPEGGETPEEKIESYRRFLDHGLPVFSIDYCVSKKNAARVYREARKAGLVPLVTRVSLDHLTETPPPP